MVKKHAFCSVAGLASGLLYTIRRMFQKKNPYIYEVKFIHQYNCYLNDRSRSDLYLKCEKDGTLGMKALPADPKEKRKNLNK